MKLLFNSSLAVLKGSQYIVVAIENNLVFITDYDKLIK